MLDDIFQLLLNPLSCVWLPLFPVCILIFFDIYRVMHYISLQYLVTVTDVTVEVRDTVLHPFNSLCIYWKSDIAVKVSSSSHSFWRGNCRLFSRLLSLIIILNYRSRTRSRGGHATSPNIVGKVAVINGKNCWFRLACFCTNRLLGMNVLLSFLYRYGNFKIFGIYRIKHYFLYCLP